MHYVRYRTAARMCTCSALRVCGHSLMALTSVEAGVGLLVRRRPGPQTLVSFSAWCSHGIARARCVDRDPRWIERRLWPVATAAEPCSMSSDGFSGVVPPCALPVKALMLLTRRQTFPADFASRRVEVLLLKGRGGDRRIPLLLLLLLLTSCTYVVVHTYLRVDFVER